MTLNKKIEIIEQQVENLRQTADCVDKLRHPYISSDFIEKANTFFGNIHEEIEDLNMMVSKIILNNNL